MKEMQKKIEEFVKKHGLGTTAEIRALDLASELGELAKEIIKSTDYGRRKATVGREIEQELGDVLFSTVCLANKYSVDLEKALNSAIKKYEERLQKGGAGSEFKK